MLCADFMPRSHDTTLEKREGAFDGVCMNVPHHIDTSAVIDCLMPSARNASGLHGEWIRREVIGHNYVHIFTDVLSNELRESAGFYVLGFEHAQFTVALADANDNLLRSITSGVALPARSTSTYVG